MQFKKHIHVLNLLSQIPVGKIETKDANDAWDHIFYYIYEHWAKPLSAAGADGDIWSKQITAAELTEWLDCENMLLMSHNELIAKLESLPPYFSESVFPVAVGRYLLRDLRLPMAHRSTKTFYEFHLRYGRMILED